MHEDYICQLCGVSFSFARIRRAEEPRSKAWTYDGSDYIDDPICDVGSGCTSLDEMTTNILLYRDVIVKVCTLDIGSASKKCLVVRKVICISRKNDDWEEEADDQDFEKEGNFFPVRLGIWLMV